MNWAACELLSTAELGRLGEDCAAALLASHGVDIVGRNVSLSVGEIDLIARIEGKRTAVEVRSTRRRPGSMAVAIDAFDPAKAVQVRRVAREARCSRVDLISVCFHPGGVDLHWVPRVV